MKTYISILRGINVSGHKIIKMDALKNMCINLGFNNVQTYIQSGNIVYKFRQTETNNLNKMISETILNTFGFEVPVVTKSAEQLQEIIKNNPFTKDTHFDPAFFHITFLSDSPDSSKIQLLDQAELKNDKFALIDKAIYLYCPNSYSSSKLSNCFIENKLKVTATTRNWKTVNELMNLAEKIEL
jgi:uncharacterized protein (DUF1697 family)